MKFWTEQDKSDNEFLTWKRIDIPVMDLISVSPHWSMYSLCSVKFFFFSSFLRLCAALTLCSIPHAWEWLGEALIIVLILYAESSRREESYGDFYSLRAQISPFQTCTSVRNCKLMTSEWVRFLYECAPFSFLTQHKWECYLLHLMYRHTQTEMDFVPVSLTSWPAQLTKRWNCFWTLNVFKSILYI